MGTALKDKPLPEAKVLNLAAGYAEAAGFGLPGEAPYWAEGVEERRRAFGVDDELHADLAVRIAARFEKMRATLA